MTKAELIKVLRYCGAPEADDKRIAELQKQVNEFIKNETRSTVIKVMSRRISELEEQLPKEGEWIESEDLESAMKGKVVCSICGEPQFALELTNEFVRMKNQKNELLPELRRENGRKGEGRCT